MGRVDRRYSTASKLIDKGYLWGPILIVIGLPLVLVVVGVFVLLAGAILLILGKVGVIILEFNLYSAEENALYLVAGILSIVGFL